MEKLRKIIREIIKEEILNENTEFTQLKKTVPKGLYNIIENGDGGPNSRYDIIRKDIVINLTKAMKLENAIKIIGVPLKSVDMKEHPQYFGLRAFEENKFKIIPIG